MFSLTFSQDKAEEVDYRKKYNEEQQYSRFLEEKVATYERVLGKYEKLEEKLNDKLLASASQNYNVDQFYTSAWDKLQNETDRKINWILGLVAAAFGVIGIIAIMPIYQSFKARSIFLKIEAQEKKIKESQEELKDQEKRLLDEMGEAYFLMILNSVAFLEDSDKKHLLKTTLDCFERIIKCYIKTSNIERLSGILSGLLMLKNEFFNDIEEKEEIMKKALKEVKISLVQFNEVFDSDKMEWNEAKQKEVKEMFGLI